MRRVPDVSDMNAPEPSSFGELLRSHRVDAGLSQEALAARAGLSARAISALECGVNRAPRSATLDLLAAALELDPVGRAAFEAVAWRRRAPRAAPASVHRNRRRPIPVPIPLTHMIGRGRELAEVCALVERADVRLLTLVGPWGVGKTRLALQVASDTERLFPGGATFVPLDGIASGNALLPALARALDLDDAGPAPRLRERVAGRLQRPELLVLDTFEHVVDAAPEIATLCEACPALTVLVTSRRALHLRGERQFTVPPLETSPSQDLGLDLDLGGDDARDAAVRLFVERLCAVRPAVPLTNAHLALIARACLFLDGLPLAIELAAAGAERLPLPALLGRIAGPAAGRTGVGSAEVTAADAGVAAGGAPPCPAWPDLEVLGGGACDLPPRQRTMSDAIGWSYDLLTPAEQSLFRRLAAVPDIHTGGVARRASSTLDLSPARIGAGLASLADHNLLQRQPDADGEECLQMLHTVRAFGLEQAWHSGEAVPRVVAHG